MFDSLTKDQELFNIYETCRSFHPLRPLDWRWKLVSFKNKLNIFPSSVSFQQDIFLQKADLLFSFIPENNRHKPNRYLEYIKNVPEEIRLAYFIYKNEDALENFPLLKSGIESYLLTRLPFSEISKKTNIPEETIQFYEGVFFNVRDRLDNVLWILNVCIGYESLVSIPLELYHKYLWKIYAYFGGEEVLEKIMSITAPNSLKNINSPSESYSMLDHFNEELKQILFFKASLMARNLQLDENGMKTVFSYLSKILQPKSISIQQNKQISTAILSATNNNSFQDFSSLDSTTNSFFPQEFTSKLFDFIKNIPISVKNPQFDQQSLSNKETCSLLSEDVSQEDKSLSINNSLPKD